MKSGQAFSKKVTSLCSQFLTSGLNEINYQRTALSPVGSVFHYFHRLSVTLTQPQE